jgi:hypothetical protein
VSALHSQPPPPDPRLVPVLATVTWVAAVIALWGFTSLALDENPIEQDDAGPLLGPVMVAAGCIATLVAMLRARERPRGVGHAAAAAASVYTVMLVVGALGYTLVRADLTWLVIFVGAYALSPFVIGAAVLSAVGVYVVWAVSRR